MSVARMREAIFGVGITFFPGYRFSHPGYDVLVIASWDRWIRHRPALDESLRFDVGSMTPFLSDFLPRSESDEAIQTFFRRTISGLLRFARNDDCLRLPRLKPAPSRHKQDNPYSPFPRHHRRWRGYRASTGSHAAGGAAGRGWK